MTDYRRNHYVPQWFQRRFIPNQATERKLHYLDLRPETKIRNGRKFQRKSLMRWGTPRCFVEEDLYTTFFGEMYSTEIEEKFFGEIDRSGKNAVDYFSHFEHPDVNHEAFQSFLVYLSTQKLRTPKGLKELARLVETQDKNSLLFELQRLKQLYCAVWTEAVWLIAKAPDEGVGFILSDHPVTVYNQSCFPASKWCRNGRDPDIRMVGTHTLFPLDIRTILILTNLSWARNPYQSATNVRPNPSMLRPAMFNFMDIQTHRQLTDHEVHCINYIIKQRARRYVAAGEKSWLYPEDNIQVPRWDRIGTPYWLMPDPRGITFSTETFIGYEGGHTEAFDEYGTRPWQEGYNDNRRKEAEWNTLYAFKGEFARLFGPKRRGRSYTHTRLDPEEDDPDFHQYHLSLEGHHKARFKRRG